MGTQAFNLTVSLFETLIGHCCDAFPGQVSLLIDERRAVVCRLSDAY